LKFDLSGVVQDRHDRDSGRSFRKRRVRKDREMDRTVSVTSHRNSQYLGTHG